MNELQFAAALKGGKEDEILNALKSAESQAPISIVKSLLALLAHPNKLIARQAVVSSAILIKTRLISSWDQIEKNVKDGLATLLKKLDPQVVDQISKDLYSGNEQNRLRVLQVLGLLGQDDKIKQAVSRLLTETDERLRATAISILKRMAGEKDLSLIYRVMQDGDPRVRANGVEALEVVGGKNAVTTLLKMRTDSNNRVRGNVLKALYTLGFKEVVNDLKGMLDSRERLMRATAGWVLGEVGKSQESIFLDLIGEYGLDFDTLVRSNMVKALLKIGNESSLKICRYTFAAEEIKQATDDMQRMRKFRG